MRHDAARGRSSEGGDGRGHVLEKGAGGGQQGGWVAGELGCEGWDGTGEGWTLTGGKGEHGGGEGLVDVEGVGCCVGLEEVVGGGLEAVVLVGKALLANSLGRVCGRFVWETHDADGHV